MQTECLMAGWQYLHTILSRQFWMYLQRYTSPKLAYSFCVCGLQCAVWHPSVLRGNCRVCGVLGVWVKGATAIQTPIPLLHENEAATSPYSLCPAQLTKIMTHQGAHITNVWDEFWGHIWAPQERLPWLNWGQAQHPQHRCATHYVGKEHRFFQDSQAWAQFPMTGSGLVPNLSERSVHMQDPASGRQGEDPLERVRVPGSQVRQLKCKF